MSGTTMHEHAERTCLALKSVPGLDSAVSRQLVRWQINAVCDSFGDGDPDPRALCIPGGWKELSRALFNNDELFADELREAAFALSRAQIITTTAASRGMPNGFASGMITVEESASKDALSGLVRMTVGTLLVPYQIGALAIQLASDGIDTIEKRALARKAKP